MLKSLACRSVGFVDMLQSVVVDLQIVPGLSRYMAVLGRRRPVRVDAKRTKGALSVAKTETAKCAIPRAGVVQGERLVRGDEAFEVLALLNDFDAFLESRFDPELGLRVPDLEAGKVVAPLLDEHLVE